MYQIVVRQKWLSLLILITLTLRIECWPGKVLDRLMLPVVGLATSYIQVRTGIEIFKQDGFSYSKPVDHQTEYLFNSAQQDIFRQLLKGRYPVDKPFFFGLSTEPKAKVFHDAYYVYFPFTLKPTIGCVDSIFLLLGLKEMSVKNLLECASKEDVERYINKEGFTINHELGHIQLNHQKRLIEEVKRMSGAVIAAGLSYNLWAMVVKHNTLAKQLMHGVLMSSVLPLSNYSIMLFAYAASRRYESEADDHAIQQAKSVDELIQGKRFLLSLQDQAKSSDSLYDSLSEVKKRLFSTHPANRERIEKLQHAIDTWGNRSKNQES